VELPGWHDHADGQGFDGGHLEEHIADKAKVTVPQVLLRWAVQKGLVVIPGTSNPKHMSENLAAYSVELSDADMRSIDALSSDPIAKEFMFGPQDEN
jgi:diketogulonate reductase-like aldo/keto reductase